MREEPIRSLLLLDANADERRLDLGDRRACRLERRRRAPTTNSALALAARAAWSRSPRGAARQVGLPNKGPQLIAALREQRATCRSSFLSNGECVADAVEAMRAGASDFLVRPVAPERLLEALAANADRRRAAGELAPVSEKLAPPLALEQLVGAAPEFRAALAVAAKSARNRLPILIVGEPGTGKETVARAIHAASLRAKGPLLTLDCKAVAANIIDSELFGHEKGRLSRRLRAPRPASSSRPTAARLLLDDIGALPADTQELLDRVLATGEVRPVGLNGSYSVDVRVIATSSRPLPDDFHPGLAERIGATTVTLAAAARPQRRHSRPLPATCSAGLPSRRGMTPAVDRQ